ncbi:hypothetical protein [Brevibacterium ihuae]|uniref:hypothetical protein n=1 Tax=Brevibacterium ihuae TaxID=1631743 RepID=UPI000C783FA6|nr:hypothetical protein [Brevibacterium ihuae]
MTTDPTAPGGTPEQIEAEQSAAEEFAPEREEELAADPGDAESPEPLDGRDGQPVAGSSDEPELLDAEDPLTDPQRAADESGTLLTETPLPEDPVG